MKRAIAAPVFWLLLVSCVAAQSEIKIYPPADEAVGAMTSATEGRWIVFRAAPFGVVGSQPVTIGGQAGCLWTGPAGTYTAVLIPLDVTMPIEMGTVVLGGQPEPEPDPDPDPDPDVDVDGVVLVVEQSNATAYLEVAIRVLREWVMEQGYLYRLYDPDQPAAKPYLGAANQAGLPAILVISGEKVVAAETFPSPGSTVAAGVAAGESAVKIVKEAGG